jgi:hypothetical protein
MVGGGSSREGRRENLGEGRSRPGSMKGGENGKAADREAGERKVVAGRRGVGEVSARHGVRVLSGAFYPLPPPPGPLSISPQIYTPVHTDPGSPTLLAHIPPILRPMFLAVSLSSRCCLRLVSATQHELRLTCITLCGTLFLCLAEAPFSLAHEEAQPSARQTGACLIVRVLRACVCACKS